jgi:lipopolysaccharide transport system permease protein
MADGPAPTGIVVITPTGGAAGAGLREIWRYRQLLLFLVWRDLKVRYAQTAFGVLWAILQPLALTAIFSLFLGIIVRAPSDGIPYPAFVLAGVVPWTYFSQAVVFSSNSLVNSANLVSKVYFPRILLPLAPIGTGLIDLGLSMAALCILLIINGLALGGIALLPTAILLLMLLSAGVGTWLSALNVRYRDVRHALPFLLQIGLWASPIAYPSSLVPDEWRAVYALNPMVGIIDLFRFAFLGTGSPPVVEVLLSAAVSTAMCLLGASYFRRVERAFADII